MSAKGEGEMLVVVKAAQPLLVRREHSSRSRACRSVNRCRGLKKRSFSTGHSPAFGTWDSTPDLTAQPREIGRASSPPFGVC